MRLWSDAALWKRWVGILTYCLCLLCNAPYAYADSLALKSKDERPRWTSWHSVGLGGVGLDQYDIVFAEDRLRGWVAGRDGVILSTIDGGVSWKEQDSGVEVRLNAVHHGTKTGRTWIAGDEGVILTKDKGETAWTRRASGVKANLYSIHATANDEFVWAVGEQGTIVFSRNGGAEWAPQVSGTERSLRAVHAGPKARQAWIAGTGGMILRTTDDGHEWSAQRTGTGLALYSIHLSADGGRGLAVGKDGVVVASEDGGESWQPRSSGVYAALRAVRLSAGGDRGWAAGYGGVIILSEDGGDSWKPRSSGTNRNLFAIHLSDDGSHGWAAGRDGVLLSTEDGKTTWTILRKAVKGSLEFKAVQLSADGGRGWLAGNDGAIVASSDGGATWTVQDSGTCVDLPGLHMSADDRHGWAVGWSGTILATGDGGSAWRGQLIGSADDFRAVSMAPDGRRGWAAGDCGTIFETGNGGDTYTKVKTRTDVDLNAIHAGGNGVRSWAVGEDGAMFATDDHKSRWVQQPSVTDRELHSVHFSGNGRYGWAAGRGGTILATTDGGATWTRQTTGTRESLRSVLFAGDDRRGWAVGRYGAILTTEDGGDTWISRNSQTSQHLTYLHFSADGRHGWAVGQEGTIVTTENGGMGWTPGSVGRNDDLVGVHFAADNRSGWTVSEDGNVYFTVDRGNSWSEQKDLDIRVEGVHVAADGGRIWAVGWWGEILTAGRGWATPTKRLGGKDFDLTAVHGAADNRRGWAVGSYGTILATNDGGDKWMPQESGGEEALNAVRVTADGGRRWAAGDDGRILASGEGRVRWTPQVSKTDRHLNAIDIAADGQRGWAVGRSGTILSIGDGGKEWIVRRESTDDVFNAIRMADDGQHGWAVGREGVIVATSDGWKTWTKLDAGVDFDLEAIDVAEPGDAIQGWIVGRANRILVAGKPNGTPYLTSFDATKKPNGDVALEFAAADKEGDSIEVAGIEMCNLQKSEPLCEELGLENLARQDNRWSLAWDPSTTRKSLVGSGSQLQFSVTLRDGRGGFSFKHATATNLEYGGWYERMRDRYRAEIFSVLSVIGLIILYVLVLLCFFVFNPVILVKISRALSADASTDSLFQKPVQLVFLVLHTIVLPRLARHPRTVQAWILRYKAKKAGFAGLSPGIRSQYLNEPDVLDAWVATRAGDAGDAILSRRVAAERSVFVDLPVTLEEDDGLEAVPNRAGAVEMVRTVLGRKPGVIAICGAGGGGKTTFAAQVARWAWSEDEEERAFRDRAIPVWIDFDTKDLLRAVIEELRRMVGGDETDEDIVKALLASKRVLVIVDGLTERKRETQLHVWHIYGSEVEFNALVLTGRVEPNMERVPVVRLSLIDDRTIRSFIREYAASAHRNVKFADRTQDEIAGRVLAIVGQRGRKVPMTPLLVCLFVKSAAEQIERDGKFELDTFMDSVPETIIDYLKSVNPQDEDTPDRLENAFMITVVKALSRAAIEPDFVPGDLDSEKVGGAIDRARSKYLDGSGSAGVDAETIVRRLVANDVVEKRSVAGNEWLRFKFDPVAEYMAAIDLLEDCGRRDADWAALFERLEGEDFAGVGFLSCLFDVVSTYADDFAVPEGVKQRLDALAGDSVKAEVD